MSSRDSYKANILEEAMSIVLADPDIGHDFLDCWQPDDDRDTACDACRALVRANRRLGVIVRDLRHPKIPAAAVAAGVQ